MIKPFSLLAGLGLCAFPALGYAVSLQMHAKSWTDIGRVMHSTDTLQTNFNRNWEQSMGVQMSATAELGPNLEGGLGFGMFQVYHSLGSTNQEKFTLSKFFNYVSDAHVTYWMGDRTNPFFSATAGDFMYNYNPEVKNLGLYLFRGAVYPGFLVSGFKDFHTDTTRASFLGLHLHNALGNFSHDLLLYSERDLPPSFDWSLGYVAKYRLFDALDIGAGANFYHLIPDDAGITTPDGAALFSQDSSLTAQGGSAPYDRFYTEGRIDTVRDEKGQIVIDTASGLPKLRYQPTLAYTDQGIKVMAMFDLDIKKALGLTAPFGERDLKLYGEGGIIGVKNYGSVYAHINERIPFMFGFNLPAFGILDVLSVEVEHYGAKYKADYSKLGYNQSLYFKNIAPPRLLAQKAPSPIPISLNNWVDLVGSNQYQLTPDGNLLEIQTGKIIPVKGTDLDPENQTADDWKWSLNVEKTFAGHVQFSAQAANDHYVPRPVRGGLISENSGLSEIFSSMKDWYFMARVGYLF
jgi:hypothetical protein